MKSFWSWLALLVVYGVYLTIGGFVFRAIEVPPECRNKGDARPGANSTHVKDRGNSSNSNLPSNVKGAKEVGTFADLRLELVPSQHGGFLNSSMVLKEAKVTLHSNDTALSELEMPGIILAPEFMRSVVKKAEAAHLMAGTAKNQTGASNKTVVGHEGRPRSLGVNDKANSLWKNHVSGSARLKEPGHLKEANLTRIGNHVYLRRRINDYRIHDDQFSGNFIIVDRLGNVKYVKSAIIAKKADCDTWNFYNSFFFSFTAVTTIGYGHLAPTTKMGKLFCVVYSVIGIAINGILVGSIAAYFSKKLDAFRKKRQQGRRFGYLGKKLFLVFHITAYLIPGIFVFMLIPAAIFYQLEANWSYVDSTYFAFVTLATIGFGDFVPGRDQEVLEKMGDWRMIYEVGIIIWITFGLGYVFMVISVITSAITKPTRKALGKLKAADRQMLARMLKHQLQVVTSMDNVKSPCKEAKDFSEVNMEEDSGGNQVAYQPSYQDSFQNFLTTTEVLAKHLRKLSAPPGGPGAAHALPALSDSGTPRAHSLPPGALGSPSSSRENTFGSGKGAAGTSHYIPLSELFNRPQVGEGPLPCRKDPPDIQVTIPDERDSGNYEAPAPACIDKAALKDLLERYTVEGFLSLLDEAKQDLKQCHS